MDVSEQRIGPAKETAPSLGQVLQNARTARALTVEQLATELRIEAPQLRALEQNEFERIGPPVFVKGYLRQYGARLGLEYRDLLGLYYEQVEDREVVVQPSRTIKLRDERQITIWIIAALVLAVLGVALAVWWVNNGRPLGFLSAAEDDGAQFIDSASAAQPPHQAAGVTERVPAQGSQIATAAVHATPAERAVAETRANTASQPSTPAIGAPSATSAGHPAGRAGQAAIPGEALELVLQFHEESWAEVTAAGGERLFYGLGAPGRRAVLVGVPPIDVLLGNADGVALEVDGVARPITGRRGNLARFSLPASARAAD